MKWWVEMTFDRLADAGLNYYPCRYGKSRVLFRGPKRRLDGAYVAAVGGTETYGKFVRRPYPDLLEDQIGMTVVNLGATNAGVDVFHGDPAVLAVCSGARVVVLQVMGAQNLTNCYYSVHPRRNDRFLKASPMLRLLYPEVDFTEFHFTRHLVQSLHATDPDRFERVRNELQAAWLTRMSEFVAAIDAPVVLFQMTAPRPAPGPGDSRAADPLFVSPEMVDALGESAASVIDLDLPLDDPGPPVGMVCSELEATAAAELPDAPTHACAALAIAQGIRHLI